MNILFVLYGDFTSNSANPLTLYARELRSAGHNCAITVPHGLETVHQHGELAFRPILYRDVLNKPKAVFPNGYPADVIHACTPREVVRRFVTEYMQRRPTPFIVLLEDNERWITLRALGLQDHNLVNETDWSIAQRLPDALSHPFRYDSFIGLADAAAAIQDKLKNEVPPWVPCETVMLGVDLQLFSPRPPDPSLRKRFGVADDERVIVYHGGLNGFTRAAIESLCKAIVLINHRGISCRLLRSGPVALDFLDQFPAGMASTISDLGVLCKADLPELLALADVFVQPGQKDPFEDQRLPGKLPEFLAMGRPVVLPDANIAHLFRDGIDAMLLRKGTAEEIADRCVELFWDSEKAETIGKAGRRLAEEYFDVRKQAQRLEHLYKLARDRFDLAVASVVWRGTDLEVPVTVRLIRKLTLLAESKNHGSEVEGMWLHTLAQSLGRLHQRLARLERGIDTQDAIATRDRMIAEMLDSASWRMTRPLRQAKSSIKRIRHLFEPFRVAGKQVAERVRFIREAYGHACQRYGGAWSTTSRVLAIVKREGLLGLKRQYIRYQRGNRYPEWIRLYDLLTDDMRAIIRSRIESLSYRPLISIVMPTYNPELRWLSAAIESVQQQLYPYWELCIADDASTDPNVRPMLERYADRDSRIKLFFRNVRGHISAASNSALELASGDYFALLDHDDLLSEHALFWVASEINRYPNVKLIYSDEDKIDVAGKRSDPYFKCDWNVDLFYSHNLITHLGVYRTDLVRTIEGFRVGYEGAQDYDLALRSIERIEANDIRHIPRVLYHWRMHPESTATGTGAKPYALDAGKRAISEHLERRGVCAQVQPLEHLGMYRVRYELSEPGPMASLIIPMRNELKLTQQCITSVLRRTTYGNYEILIVDNGSDDTEVLSYLQSLKNDSRIRIIRDDRPFSFPALNNNAVQEARGEVLALVNNDVEVISPDWLSEMVSHAVRTEIGAVGARLLYPNGTLQHGGVILGIGGVAGHANKKLPRYQYGYFARAVVIQSVSAVTAACLVIRKELYEKVGGFDENLKVAYNDIDFCLKIRAAGYRNLYTPYAELYHHESATRGYENTLEKRLRHEAEYRYIKQRWGNLLDNDPAYSPNLTLEIEDFSFAWPPRVASTL
jgi:glycosyltransferase involved in cell wall biosynthesis